MECATVEQQSQSEPSNVAKHLHNENTLLWVMLELAPGLSVSCYNLLWNLLNALQPATQISPFLFHHPPFCLSQSYD